MLKKIVVLCVIYTFTILITIYLCVLYKNSSSNISFSNVTNYISDVSATKYEVLYNNISNYSNENDFFCVYVASYKFLNLNSFENSLKKYIIEHNLKNIIYVNADILNKTDNLQKLLSDFNYSDFYNLVDNLPVFVIFKDGVIVDVVNVYEEDISFLDKIMEDTYD